jgi:hypothetical protein
MRRRFVSGLLVLAVALAVPVLVTAQAQDAWVGTWKLNLAKSKYDPANLAPKSQTVKLEAVAGGGMKTTVDLVDAQGQTLHQVLTTKFDGKSADLAGAADANTTRVYKRIDSRTYEFVTSVNGKVTTTSRSVVSADGKTRTITSAGTDAQGRAIKNVVVYDRQ